VERTIKSEIKGFFDDAVSAYSNLFFAQSRLVGLILLSATLFNFNIAVQGFISLTVSILFARFIGIKKDEPVNKLFAYNALITGFAIGFLFKVTALSFLLTFGMSVFTVLLTYTLSSALYNYFKLPVLNLPFTISATIVYLASAKYSNLIVDSFYKQEHFNLDLLPRFISHFLRSLGILIFMPYDLIGLIILLALLFYSRITFLAAIVSFYAGTFFLALLKGSLSAAFTEVSSFNFILVGVSLGGMFLIPSKRTYLITLTAVLTSVFIIDAASVLWTVFGIPVFTIPFNLTVLLYIYVLGSERYLMMNQTPFDQPEKSLVNHLNYKNRFDWVTPSINLPFMGKWTVYQAFEGEWTHKGSWKYAYDFLIEENGKTFKGDGSDAGDYYCFGKPVVSPVDGTVVDIFDELEDNKIGEADKINNWGNYIVIYSPAGYYVEISHLKKGSVKVKKNDTVSKGRLLAECGNSGYSPEPHLHIQLQYSYLIGSAGIEFRFNSLKLNGKDVEPKYLKKGDTVMPLSDSKHLTHVLQFILDEEFDYKVSAGGIGMPDLKLTVRMAFDGTYYFDDGSGNRLYFGADRDRFVFFKYDGNSNSPLKYFFLAMPSVPLSDDEDMEWNEYIPENVHKLSGVPLFVKSFRHDMKKTTGFYAKQDRDTIAGRIVQNGGAAAQTVAVLCQKKGFKTISFKNGKISLVIEKI
jgi:urea transporter